MKTLDPQAVPDAYRVMARLLPPSYFTSPPPDHGAAMRVVGADGVSTKWFMSHGLAEPMLSKLAKEESDLRFMVEPYDDRGPR